MIEETEKFRAIDDPKEQRRIMMATGLAIQLAGYEPDEAVFLAAHGDTQSVLLARFPLESTHLVWLVREGTKVERKALAELIRSKLPPVTA